MSGMHNVDDAPCRFCLGIGSILRIAQRQRQVPRMLAHVGRRRLVRHFGSVTDVRADTILPDVSSNSWSTTTKSMISRNVVVVSSSVSASASLHWFRSSSTLSQERTDSATSDVAVFA